MAVWWKTLLAVVGLALLLGLALMFFLLPWVLQPAPGGPLLQRYQPYQDGAAWLYAVAENEVQALLPEDAPPPSWEGTNVERLPIGPALTGQLAPVFREALVDFYFGPDASGYALETLFVRARNTEVLRLRGRAVAASGAMTDTLSLLVRTDQGDYLLGIRSAGQEFVFSPALPFLPAHLQPGHTWTGQGTLGATTYRWRGEVLQAGPFDTPLGVYPDCLLVEQTLELLQGEALLSWRQDGSWFCAEVGPVQVEERSAPGQPGRRKLLVAATRLPDSVREQVRRRPWLLPLAGAAHEETAAEPSAPDSAPRDALVMSRVGRTRQLDQFGESTMPPVWLPGEPPLLLGAGYLGDLVAFDVSTGAPSVAWQFHPGGAMYGPPGYDPRREIIYVGASNKRLYALNRQGLYLWSRAVGDNVASRPLVVGDVVVFGGEDRRIYGLDASTGALRWQVEAGGPVVSSPAYAGGVVAIGADDGAVYGLDPATGAQRWLYDSGDPVEAPIVADADAFYAVNWGGSLVALDPASGAERWRAEPGDTLRTAPARSPEALFVVDDFGVLWAFDRRSGERLWRTVGTDYVGPPGWLGGSLFVADMEAHVHRLDPTTGAVAESWSPDAARAPTDPAPQLQLGLSVGGGALWSADASAVIRRLGPGGQEATGPRLIWTHDRRAAPFYGADFLAGPIATEDGFLVLDGQARLHRVDPLTGAVETLVQLDAAAPAVIAPTVDGDRFFAPIGSSLYAVDLTGPETIWRYEADGVSLQPPAAVGTRLYWTTLQPEGGQARLHALDALTGARLWTVDLPPSRWLGSATADQEAVYVSAPPAAFAAADGRLLWQVEEDAPGAGRPGLNPEGDVVYVSLLDQEQNAGVYLAVDARTGAILWRATAEGVLGLQERLWIDADLLIAPTLARSGEIIALDRRSGALRWRHQPPAPRLGTALVDAGRVWFTLQDGRTQVLDAATGALLMTLGDLSPVMDVYMGPQRPAFQDGILLVSLGDRLLAYRVE